jgi:hypothetical protein
VQRTSESAVRGWLKTAGFHPVSMKPVLRPAAQKLARWTTSVMNSWLAHEFIVTATKIVETTPGRGAELSHHMEFGA